MRRCIIVHSGGVSWSIYLAGTSSGVQTFNLPASAASGSVTVQTTSAGRPIDGTSFIVQADGITKLVTGCINDGSQSCAIPAGTLQILVTVTNNCLAGGGASWVISGSGG